MIIIIGVINLNLNLKVKTLKHQTTNNETYNLDYNKYNIF